MLHARKDLEERESRELAPYACHSADTLGRVHEEPQHAYRTDFQRDRDRITHSPSFRRLEYKTQVFVNGTADHYRTRLTHTFEMAAVARTLARALGANEDLAETIALAHDIGHSPFGHSGEDALDELMKHEGGFDHNVQSLRWVEILEARYPDYNGLNLTWEVRAGLRKHLAREPGQTLDGLPIGPHQCMEAQIADVADDITYHAHDVDDGLDAGLLTEKQLEGTALWLKARERAEAEFPAMPESHRLNMTVRCLLDLQVENVLETSRDQLEKHKPQSPKEVMNCPERIVKVSDDMKRILDPFRSFLYRDMYWHTAVARANDDAVLMMRRLFLYYVEHPDTMGSKARARIGSEGLWRTACDYVSGMTDRYAIEEYQKFGLEGAPS